MDVLVSAEQMANLRLLLAIGFGIVFAVLLFELTAGLERRSRPGVAVKDVPPAYELCKLHQRPTDKCRDMHSPASDDQSPEGEETNDDSAG